MKFTLKKAASLITCAAMTATLIQGIPASTLHADAADYSWSSILKYEDDWFGTSEGTELADTILQYQLDDGGWRKAMDNVDASGFLGKIHHRQRYYHFSDPSTCKGLQPHRN